MRTSKSDSNLLKQEINLIESDSVGEMKTLVLKSLLHNCRNGEANSSLSLLSDPHSCAAKSITDSDDMDSDNVPLFGKRNSPIKGAGVESSTPVNKASIGKKMFDDSDCTNIYSTVSVHEDLTPELKRQRHSGRSVNAKASKRRRLLNSDSENDESACKTLSGSQEYESFCTRKTEKETVSQSGGEHQSSLLSFPDFLSDT